MMCRFIRIKVDCFLPSPAFTSQQKGGRDMMCPPHRCPADGHRVPPKALAGCAPSSWLVNDFQIYGLRSQHTSDVNVWGCTALSLQGPHPLHLNWASRTSRLSPWKGCTVGHRPRCVVRAGKWEQVWGYPGIRTENTERRCLVPSPYSNLVLGPRHGRESWPHVSTAMT